MEKLDGYALAEASKITHIKIPENVKTVEKSALPPNATVEVSENNPYLKSVSNMILSKDGKILYTASRAVKNFNVPSTVEKIENGAFFNNSAVQEVILPSSIKQIGDEGFSTCKNLRKITIPNTIETIATNAFTVCNNLTDIIITNIDSNKKEGSIVGSPWGCLYGARAVKWEM